MLNRVFIEQFPQSKSEFLKFFYSIFPNDKGRYQFVMKNSKEECEKLFEDFLNKMDELKKNTNKPEKDDFISYKTGLERQTFEISWNGQEQFIFNFEEYNRINERIRAEEYKCYDDLQELLEFFWDFDAKLIRKLSLSPNHRPIEFSYDEFMELKNVITEYKKRYSKDIIFNLTLDFVKSDINIICSDRLRLRIGHHGFGYAVKFTGFDPAKYNGKITIGEDFQTNNSFGLFGAPPVMDENQKLPKPLLKQ